MKDEMLSVAVLVVDFDNTLFIHSFWTRLFFSISKFWHRLALRSEKLNKNLAEDIHGRKVIILTGRNLEEEKELLDGKLKRHKIRYDEIILCPRTKMTMDWKRRELEKIRERYGSYFWIDDMK